jgi:polyferredoxin
MFKTGSLNMLSTVPAIVEYYLSRSSALSWALCPISFGSVVFKLGAKTSNGLQCRAHSLSAALVRAIILYFVFIKLFKTLREIPMFSGKLAPVNSIYLPGTITFSHLTVKK